MKATAEAQKFTKEQEAAGIRMVGEAEAEAIRAKGIAEAEAWKRRRLLIRNTTMPLWRR